ncbi:MAG: hypothetical protein D6805_01420 [Planctomycetota bacterium]|nr:MAG: hypothetical protein D6805_01420 [Planctomycetota bacterium]
MNRKRIYLGALIWGCLLASPYLLMDKKKSLHQELNKMKNFFVYLHSSPLRLKIKFHQNVYLSPSDPVNYYDGEMYVVIGRVIKKISYNKGCEVWVEMFPDKFQYLSQSSQFYYYEDSGTAESIVETLLKGRRGKELKKYFQNVLEKQKKLLKHKLQPAFDQIVSALSPYIQQGLIHAVSKRQNLLTNLLEEKLLNQNLISSVQTQVTKSLEKRAPPILQPIAMEVWEKFPVTSIIFHELSHKIGFKKSGMDKLREFLENEGTKIIKKHENQIKNLFVQVARDVTSSPKVAQTFQDSLNQILNDPRFQKIIKEVLQEGIVENEHLQQALMKELPKILEMLSNLMGDMDDLVREITNQILCKNGNPKEGINPALARILRQQILWKETEWLQIKTPTPGPPPAEGTVFIGKIAGE